ncbi:MAG: hypothetical protein OXN89_24175 [Bryobacterales bacterium]|nr:hypothetical protein [Bryobacterales bacterium]
MDEPIVKRDELGGGGMPESATTRDPGLDPAVPNGPPGRQPDRAGTLAAQVVTAISVALLAP